MSSEIYLYLLSTPCVMDTTKICFFVLSHSPAPTGNMSGYSNPVVSDGSLVHYSLPQHQLLLLFGQAWPLFCRYVSIHKTQQAQLCSSPVSFYLFQNTSCNTFVFGFVFMGGNRTTAPWPLSQNNDKQ